MGKHHTAGKNGKAVPVRELPDGSRIVHIQSSGGPYAKGVQKALDNLRETARTIQRGAVPAASRKRSA